MTTILEDIWSNSTEIPENYGWPSQEEKDVRTFRGFRLLLRYL